MPQTPTPYWNSEYAGEEGAPVGFMELLPFSGSKAGTGPFRIDTSGNVTAKTVIAPNLVTEIVPSGDTTGAKDTAAIQAALNAGGTVVLAAGKFYLNAPLTIPPYTALAGQPNTTQVSQTSGGSVLVITAGFTGLTITDGSPVTLTAAIVLLGQTFGGYSTVSEEQKINNIMIDGTSAPASVSGIVSYGRLQRVRINNVLVSKVTGDGVQHNLDVAGNQPDAWYGRQVFARFCGGKGYSLRSADSTWELCLGSNNADTGVDWFINTTSNSKYIGCRSEHAGGLGFGYVCTNAGNSSGGVEFIGCSTDQSTLHGFQVGGTINSVASAAHAVALTFTGCRFRRDGANGGSGGGGFAGFYNAAYKGQVVMSGLNIWPGVNDDGTGTNSPQIGLLADSGSLMSISAAYIQGATTAITDSTTSGINYDNSVVTATGTTAAPTIVKAPNIAAYQGASLSLAPGAAPAADPLFINSANSGERAFGIRVVGQNNDKVKITSDGKVQLGPGSATQDCAFQRAAGGRLDLSTDGAAGTFQPVDPYGGGFGFLNPSGQLGHGNLARAAYTLNTAAYATSGTVFLVAYYLPAGTTVTNITFMTGTGAVKTGGTHGWYVLVTSDLKIRAVSADQTDAATVWGSASTSYPLAVTTDGTTKFVTTYSGLHYLGIMIAETSGTLPNLVAGPAMAAGVAGITPVTSAPCTGGTGTSQTTPPAADGSVTLTLGSADGGKNYLAYVT